MKRTKTGIYLFAIFFALKCGAMSAETQPLSLGFVTQKSEAEVEGHFQEFIRYVVRKLSLDSPVEGRFVVAPSVLRLANLLEEKKVDFFMDSPYPTYLIIRSGAAELFLRRWKGGAAEYRSIVFTKKDGGIARLEDLRGRIVAFEDIGSTSGYFLPKIFLQTRGLQLAEKPGLEAAVSRDEVGYVFTHSTGKIVDLVLSKKAAAGAFSNEDYDRLDGKSRAALSVLAETENFPRNLVSIRSDLEPTLAYRLRKVLLSMHEDEEGRKILQKTDNTTKFDVLPGGEKAVRRRLADLFAPREKEKTEPAR